MSLPYGAACGIILSKASFLLVQDRHSSGNLQLPGGRIQLRESPIEAFCRKCFDEAGVRIDPSRAKEFMALPYERREGEFLNQVFLCEPDAVIDTFRPPSGRNAPEWRPLQNPPWRFIRVELFRLAIVRAQRVLGLIGADEGPPVLVGLPRPEDNRFTRKEAHRDAFRRVGYLRRA